jgi:acyl carrier protein
MKATVSVTPAKTEPFPESEIRNRIKQFWNEKTDEEADNPFAPERKNTLHDVLPEIDSLEIVKFMLRIEEIIDLEIPPKVIQRGGYDSCDEMTRHLMPQLRELYAEQD